jgi:hypothetical protein
MESILSFGFWLHSTCAKDLFAKNRVDVLIDMILHNDFGRPQTVSIRSCLI